MNNLYFMIAAKSSPQGEQGSGFVLILMVVFILFFYLFIVRPQSKKKKEMEKLLNSLKNGDRVVTIGGVHGKVVKVKDDNTITIRVDDKAEITFDKNAIARVVDESGKDKTVSKEKESKNVKSMRDIEKENVESEKEKEN